MQVSNFAKGFPSKCGATKKCNNCSTYLPSMQQDAHNKIFESLLSKMDQLSNAAKGIILRPVTNNNTADALTATIAKTATFVTCAATNGPHRAGWRSEKEAEDAVAKGGDVKQAAEHKDNGAVKLCGMPTNSNAVESFNVALAASVSSVATMTATTAAALQRALENQQQQKERHIQKEHM